VARSTRRPGGGDAVVAELAAELVTAPLDLAELAALVAIALVAAVVAELVTRAPAELAAELPHRSTSTSRWPSSPARPRWRWSSWSPSTSVASPT